MILIEWSKMERGGKGERRQKKEGPINKEGETGQSTVSHHIRIYGCIVALCGMAKVSRRDR